jgi:quercetin dioxygenase-like cupin family protein
MEMDSSLLNGGTTMQKLLLLVAAALVGCADPEDPPPKPATTKASPDGGCDCSALAKPVFAPPRAVSEPEQAPANPPLLTMLSAAELEWQEFPAFGEKVTVSRLYENKRSFASSLFLKLPKKFSSSEKKHPSSLFSTVLKGSITVAVGEDKPTAIKVGGFLSIPANTSYTLTAKKGAILFLSSDGPWSPKADLR